MVKYNTQLIEKLEIFVAQACEGRDDSHGLAHMRKVCDNSMIIFSQTIDESNPDYQEFSDLVQICAMLHDVPDHKYDKDGSLKTKCCAFLTNDISLDISTTKTVMDIIDLISYSKENRAIVNNSPIDFDSLLGKFAIVRHIVSDGDKIEAIGEIGIERCAQYSLESSPGVDQLSLKKMIVDHYNEKLGRLLTEFIRTKAGKQMAIPEHERMAEIISDLDSYFDEHPELAAH